MKFFPILILFSLVSFVQAGTPIEKLKMNLMSEQPVYTPLFASDYDSGHYVPHSSIDEDSHAAGSYISTGNGTHHHQNSHASHSLLSTTRLLDNDNNDEDAPCPLPILPVSPVASDFSLFGDKPYSAYGTFTYPTAKSAMALKMFVDPQNERLVVDHVTTYHYVLNNESAICLKLTPTLTRCYNTSFFNFRQWENFYKLGLVTNNDISKFNGNGKVTNYLGKVRDHHLNHKLASIELKKIVTGKFKGFINEWIFAMAYPCSEQLFRWTFDCFEKGQPPLHVFDRPAFMTLPVSNLPAYGTFSANFNCVTVLPA